MEDFDLATSPRIRRFAVIEGNSLRFRDVQISDAAFILSLRTDVAKSAYLSAVANDIKAQEEWIDRYLAGIGQAYFIIEDLQGNSIGTVRIYDARGASFCWGSWILINGAPSFAAIESALIIYRLGVDVLRFNSAHFEVDKRNKSVWAFHERLGATKVDTTDTEFLYTMSLTAISAALSRYKRYLPNGIKKVTPI